MFSSLMSGSSLLPTFKASTDSTVTLTSVGSDVDKVKIINTLWGADLEGNGLNINMDSFYSIYNHDLVTAKRNLSPKMISKLRDSNELQKVVDILHRNLDQTLEELADHSKCDQELLRTCVLICLRVDLSRRVDPDRGELRDDFWPPDMSLRIALQRLFPKRRTFATTSDAKFLLVETSFMDEDPTSDTRQQDQSPTNPTKAFLVHPVASWGKHNTAERLKDWGYFGIQWTNNLQDHLVLEEDESRLEEERPPKIHLFHHASFLQQSKIAPDLFPEGLIEETLDSIALFLRPSEPRIKKWFEKESANLCHTLWQGPLDPLALRASPALQTASISSSISSSQIIQAPTRPRRGRNLSHYPFWGERLGRIDSVFDSMRPMNRKQWWKDTRKRDYAQEVAYSGYALSIAALLLTSLFSLLQIVL